MGVSISGSNAISGLGGSDTNFDKVLTQLKQIESGQLNRLEAWKSDWNLRYEAFTQIIEQIQAASSMLSQLSDKNNFVTKLVQSSNENVVTAVANAAAQDVQHTIKVSQTASNAIWANTSKVFDSKTDIINKTGQEETFSFVYAGKRHDFKIPANTTLESFMNMVNNSADNPGIKVSIVQTGKGYVYQIAGNDTGIDNDLYIFNCGLEGMQAAGSTSTWTTNEAMNLGDAVSRPTDFYFDLVMPGGATKSVYIKGSASPDDLVAALNNAAAGIDASYDPLTGDLTVKGVTSFSRREAGEKAYTPVSTKLTVPGASQTAKLNDAGGIAEGLSAGEKLTFTLTMDDNSERSFEIDASASVKDLFNQISLVSGNGLSYQGASTNSSSYASFSGVKGIELAATSSPSGATVEAGRMTTRTTEASGVKNELGGQVVHNGLDFKFQFDKLGDRLDGKNAGDAAADLEFTLADGDGNLTTFTIKSDATNQELLDKLTALGFGSATDADGNITLNKADIRGIYLTSGELSSHPGFTAEANVSVVINGTNPSAATPKDNLFGIDANGNPALEDPPDLTYTITTNEGKVGVLTMPSGSSVKAIMAAMQNPLGSNWKWTDKDADGNDIDITGDASKVPALGATFTDADGNEITDLDAAEAAGTKIFLNLKDVQTVGGAEIAGQVSASSNWSIQRSQNAKFQIDNWPVEMESATNKISDAIEGVVFDIQEVGEARISVSTDITSVEQSIQNFLDAVNSVLLTVNELMKYDDTKEVTSNDPNDIGNDNYSPSGLTNQKGGLLTGNYGVQLFKSRFSSVVSGTPAGFQGRQSASDVLSGDLLANLANLGIKTDTDATSDTYGLLVLAPNSTISQLQTMDKENYNDLITNHLEAVVDFFCASGIGSATSTDFRYGSHVAGITKAGSYDVTYTVLADGTITNVMVGGQPATQDKSQPGNYFSVASGDPKGLAILIDDLTVGDHPPAGEPAMQVRIKEGLVQTVNSFLKAELVFNDVSISANSTPSQIADAMYLKSQNGALMSLRDNYKKVMESIDVKIEREQRRIDTWYSRQKQIFANLETLLKQYDQQQQSLEGQLKQLSGNK